MFHGCIKRKIKTKERKKEGKKIGRKKARKKKMRKRKKGGEEEMMEGRRTFSMLLGVFRYRCTWIDIYKFR